jgi:hypothetical protein
MTTSESHSAKEFVSDNSSPTGSKQEVGFELDGHTWQFDTNRLAKVLSPKMRKFPFNPDQVDGLDAYIDNTIPNKIREDAITFFGTPPTFPKSNTELDHYEPLCKLLNYCVEACRKALGDLNGEYYRDLNFVVWDNPSQDGYSGHPLKPDLAGGINLPETEEIKENGGFYWRRPGPNGHELLLPVEVKAGWRDLVRKAGTYARCLFKASPLRKFALVLGYEYTLQEFRFLVFHHGGLTSSQALKLDENGIKDFLHIFLAIISWKTDVDAGLPSWCNDSNMMLPGAKAVQVKKVLHDTLALRGRCARVVLVSEFDKSDKRNESKTNLTIPAPESMCVSYYRFALVFTLSYLASKLRCTNKEGSTGVSLAIPLFLCSHFAQPDPKLRSMELGVKDKLTSMLLAYLLFAFVLTCLRTDLSVEGENEESLGSFLRLIMCSC